MVVLSSDEEDRDRSSSANRRYTPTKLTSTVPRTNPRRSKRARVSSSRASLGTVPSNWDEVICKFLGCLVSIYLIEYAAYHSRDKFYAI